MEWDEEGENLISRNDYYTLDDLYTVGDYDNVLRSDHEGWDWRKGTTSQKTIQEGKGTLPIPEETKWDMLHFLKQKDRTDEREHLEERTQRYKNTPLPVFTKCTINNNRSNSCLPITWNWDCYQNSYPIIIPRIVRVNIVGAAVITTSCHNF